VGGGGLVMSPIQLLTSSQGFKVINQPNGLTTIELSPQSEFKKLSQQLMDNKLQQFSTGLHINSPKVRNQEIYRNYCSMGTERPVQQQTSIQ
jgi:hypothetical protein